MIKISNHRMFHFKSKLSVVLVRNGKTEIYPINRACIRIDELSGVDSLKYVVRNLRASKRSLILKRYGALTQEDIYKELKDLLTTYDPPIGPPGVRVCKINKNTKIAKRKEYVDTNRCRKVSAKHQ